MIEKVRWGVLGAAKIALQKVIPAMQKGEWSEITAIASRDLAKAQTAGRDLGIPRAYGSYEELLADPEIEAIYNPLPNHLHVPWSVKCAEAGKHVLCEKPLSLTVSEAKELVAVRDRTGVKIGEAFMVRTHPQWLRARELVQSGRIGDLRSHGRDCSATSMPTRRTSAISREYRRRRADGYRLLPDHHRRVSIFDEEPVRVVALMERDPQMGTDRLTSAILDFPSGQAIFTCSTQLVPYQRMQIFGTKGRIEVEVPFNAPIDRPTRIFIDDGKDLFGGGIETEEFPTCDQYTIQGDLFSRAIREDTDVPVGLEHAVRNMAVIEAVARSAGSGQWEKV